MKPYIKTIFIVILACIFSCSALAQEEKDTEWAVGVQGGVNISNKHKDDNWGSKTGFNVGVFVDYKFYDFLFLRSGLKYTTKGANYTNSYSHIEDGFMQKERTKLTREIGYLHAPLLFGIHIQVTDDFALKGFLGGYVEYGVSFKNKFQRKSQTIDINSGNTVETENESITQNEQKYLSLKRGDFGAILGFEGEYKNFLLGTSYERGMRNIRVKSTNNTLYDKWRNRNGSIYLGYKFKL